MSLTLMMQGWSEVLFVGVLVSALTLPFRAAIENALAYRWILDLSDSIPGSHPLPISSFAHSTLKECEADHGLAGCHFKQEA